MRDLKAGLAAAILAAAASAALAQASAFARWRDEHKQTLQLATMVTRGLIECERAKNTELKPAQAKQLLAVLTPWRSRPKMTQDEARATIQKVQKIFEARQLTAVDKVVQEQQRRMASFGGGGGPRPGGGAPGAGGPAAGGGNRPAFDPVKAKNFNPFSPQKGSFNYERSKVRMEKLFAFLTTRASGKGGKLDLPQFGRPGGGGTGGAPGGGAPGKT